MILTDDVKGCLRELWDWYRPHEDGGQAELLLNAVAQWIHDGMPQDVDYLMGSVQ